MFENHLLLKLILGPLIIAAATLVSRRWGERISGLMIGLPLTSAPVSVFFAIEQGKIFAAGAALGSLLGMIPVAFFCLGYLVASRHFKWYFAALFGIACYLPVVWGVSYLSPTLLVTAIIVPAALLAALLVSGKPKEEAAPVASPLWDLPLRMVVATSLLILQTSLAGVLGPKWSGLLSPFPVFSFVMVTFAHRQGGSNAVWRFLRGLLNGLFGYTIFFLVVALLILQIDLAWVYFLATAAALGVNGLSLARLVWKNHSLQVTSNI